MKYFKVGVYLAPNKDTSWITLTALCLFLFVWVINFTVTAWASTTIVKPCDIDCEVFAKSWGYELRDGEFYLAKDHYTDYPKGSKEYWRQYCNDFKKTQFACK